MRHSRRGILIALGLAAFFGSCRAAAPATIRVPTFAQLVAAAGRIVVADVVEVRTAWDDAHENRVPVTLVTIRTVRTLKGPASTQMMLEFLGGGIDGRRLDVPGMPQFRPGERDVLFLRDGVRAVSPLVGFVQGRFRVTSQGRPPLEIVADYSGRPLTEADLASGEVSGARLAAPLSLARLEQSVREMAAVASERQAVRAADEAADETIAGLRSETSASIAVPLHTVLRVSLGSSPSLIDGCPDWACVIDASLADAARLLPSVGPPSVPASRGIIDPAIHAVELRWERAALGRTLDENVLALTVRSTSEDGTQTTVMFNDAVAWNAYEGPIRRLPSGQPLYDLRRVAAIELSAVLGADAAAPTNTGGGLAPKGDAARPRDRRGQGAAANGLSKLAPGPDGVVTAAAGCDPGGVVVDPRLLVFESPDHSMMTGYQVGFFQPGAPGAAQVIDVPLGAFLLRRVVDLPAWAALALQTTLVADIRAAGLATPLGVVYTYRVRGVWPGGFTEWSERSPAFVRCAATASGVGR